LNLEKSELAFLLHETFSKKSASLENESILSALQTLRSFEFSKNSSITFLKCCTHFYLQHESNLVKTEAILSSCFLLSRIIKDTKDEGKTLNCLIDSSLNKLLVCALTDIDPNVRYLVLFSLKNEIRFQDYVSLSKYFDILLRCLSDYCVEIREYSAMFLSHLSSKDRENQSKIVQIIMETFNEIILEIYPDRCENSIRLISHLICHLPNNSVIEFGSDQLLTFFHSKYYEFCHDITLCSNIFALLGILASRSSPKNFQLLNSLLPFLIESIQDSNHLQLKQTALWALGQIIENTGWVIEPYKKYPKLLQALLDIFQKETSKQTRREAIKVLGLIGKLITFDVWHCCVKF